LRKRARDLPIADRRHNAHNLSDERLLLQEKSVSDERCFRSQIEHQRETNDFELSELFEHISCAVYNARLVLRDFTDDARVIVFRNPEKGADRLSRFRGLWTRQKNRGLEAGRTFSLDQIGQEFTIIIAANLKFDRPLGFGIEQRRVLHS